MTPNIHTRHHRVMRWADTEALEWWLGVMLMACGIYLMWPTAAQLPWRVAWFMPDWLSEARLGAGVAALGLLQWWFCDTRRSYTRYLVSTSLWIVLGYLLLCYWQAGEIGRRLAAPILAVTWAAEFWVAWRAWHDARVAKAVVKGGPDD